MCFVNSYDWYAQTVERSTSVVAKERQCMECHRIMTAGQTTHCIHMEEHEECQVCLNKECSCRKDECCECSSPDFGETYDYERCEECHKFLEAVEAAELEAGCSLNESRPALESMMDELIEADDRERYFVKALEMFPELMVYLDWLRGRLGMDDD
jgi:hypothetical protein